MRKRGRYNCGKKMNRDNPFFAAFVMLVAVFLMYIKIIKTFLNIACNCVNAFHDWLADTTSNLAERCYHAQSKRTGEIVLAEYHRENELKKALNKNKD